ncbi:hypothetical protein NW766_010159 [Fusarium irregulare]|uniref:Caspase n=1 Tax=Fusarium irregulare TaxID=2494466 RepID=A0A9W8PI73_9HYPO|nr:hypothetical protein NW766_010159 [Fusarium irregulare]
MSTHRTLRPSLAPSALIVSWDASPPVEPLSTVLQEQFGYHTTPLRLPERNPEHFFKSSLADALASHWNTNNPFILYCHGNSLMRQGESRLRLAQNEKSASVDWLKLRQGHIDEFGSDILVILDCNHKVVRTAVNKYPILADDKKPGSKSIVQILVAPKLSRQDATPFPHVLAQTLRAVAESSKSGVIDIKYIKAEIARHSTLEVSPDLYSLRPDQEEDLKLTVSSHQAQSISMHSWDEPFQVNNTSKYPHVSVLPITWANVDLRDAKAELEELVDVFKAHFDFMIEKTVKIPNTSNAQSSLQTRINQQIEKVGPKGLLIVLYNGHARGTDRGMILSLTFISGSGSNGDSHSVNWTEITHTLNIANCDVVHVLDCCDALSATKGIESNKETQIEIAEAADWNTDDSEYQGINETLTAGGREQRVPAGPDSLMRVFATVLRKMAARKIPITVLSWHQYIVKELGDIRTRQGYSRHTEPHYKINPTHYAGAGQSIKLQVRQRRFTM